jgi:predicted amidohydrolase
MTAPPSFGSNGGPIPGPYRAAAIQFEPALFGKEANLSSLLAMTEEAAGAGARLIVLPEMATVAYCWGSRDEVAPFVETVPGPTTDRFAAIAARYDCYVVVALAEVVVATGVYYNSSVLIGPGGILGLYRKTHSFIAEPKWAKDGDLGLPVFDTPLGRIAMTICMDATYPETTRIPALRGADVICFPTNWLSEKSPSPTWMARALESGVWFVSANRHGEERGVQFSGGSCLIDPDGIVQASRDTGDGIVYGTIDPARARDKRLPGGDGDRIADRRPDAYGTLTLHTYLWNSQDFHGLYDLRPLPAGRRSRVGVAQWSPEPGTTASNLDRIAATMAATDADLVVFPELAACGPIQDRFIANQVAETLPGPIGERLHRIAIESNRFLVAGLVEREDDRLYNTAMLVGPDGVVGCYRKLHLTADDRQWATPGDRGLPTFDIPVGRVGLAIGYDLIFPETGRVLALDGADLIACPSLTTWPAVQPWPASLIPFPAQVDAGPTDDHLHLWRERSRENNTYVAFANGAAPYGGWSGLFGPGLEDEPRQEAMVRGDGDGVAVGVVDTTNLPGTRYVTNTVRAKDLLRMRMPIWYDPLQTPRTAIDASESPQLERPAEAIPVSVPD